MKKLIVFLSFLPLFAFSQSKDTIYPKSNGYQLVVSLDAMNVMYLGLENPVSVAINGIKNKRISISVENGTVTSFNGLQYKIHPEKIGKTTIKVYVKKRKKLLFYGSITYHVRYIPDPILKINLSKKSGDTISKLDVPSVSANLDNFFFSCVKFDIKSYSFHFNTNNDINVTGPNLTQQIFNIIINCKSRDKLFFTNIKVSGPDGLIRNLPDAYFIVK